MRLANAYVPAGFTKYDAIIDVAILADTVPEFVSPEPVATVSFVGQSLADRIISSLFVDHELCAYLQSMNVDNAVVRREVQSVSAGCIVSFASGLEVGEWERYLKGLSVE